MPFEIIHNHRVYYEVHGKGETLFLLHHGFGCLKIWKDIHPRFVSEGYQVIMYDRRGYGQSERGDNFVEFYESDRYRPESLEELRQIKDYFGIGPCHIVGQCEGGVIGVDFAVRYPDEIMTLTVASTQCFSEMPMRELNIVRLVNQFDFLDPDLQAKVVDWHGDAAEMNYNQFAKYGGAYGIEYFDLRPKLSAVKCPTLVLYPDRSSIFDVEQSVAFYRHLPKGELAVFPRCGHNTYDQRPEEYMRTILDFIERSRNSTVTKTTPKTSCLA